MHYETGMRVGVWGCGMGQVKDNIRNISWLNPEMFFKSMHLKMGLSSVTDSLIHEEVKRDLQRGIPKGLTNLKENQNSNQSEFEIDTEKGM